MNRGQLQKKKKRVFERNRKLSHTGPLVYFFSLFVHSVSERKQPFINWASVQALGLGASPPELCEFSRQTKALRGGGNI